MDIYGKIKDVFSDLSKGNQKIAVYILKHREDLLMLTARELSKKIGVSEATTIRFARTLGYATYKEMLKAIKKDSMQSSSVMTIFDEMLVKHEMPGENYLDTVNQDIENINRTFRNLDGNVLDDLVDRIIAARNIGVIGFRGELTPAVFLSHFLNELFSNTKLLYPNTGDSYDQIKSWDDKDLIISFAFWENSNYTKTIMQYAKSRGCYLVAITREQSKEICSMADTYIPVETKGAFISYTASVTLVNVILALVTKKLPADALYKAFKDTDEIFSYFNNAVAESSLVD